MVHTIKDDRMEAFVSDLLPLFPHQIDICPSSDPTPLPPAYPCILCFSSLTRSPIILPVYLSTHHPPILVIDPSIRPTFTTDLYTPTVYTVPQPTHHLNASPPPRYIVLLAFRFFLAFLLLPSFLASFLSPNFSLFLLTNHQRSQL